VHSEQSLHSDVTIDCRMLVLMIASCSVCGWRHEKFTHTYVTSVWICIAPEGTLLLLFWFTEYI